MSLKLEFALGLILIIFSYFYFKHRRFILRLQRIELWQRHKIKFDKKKINGQHCNVLIASIGLSSIGLMMILQSCGIL